MAQIVNQRAGGQRGPKNACFTDRTIRDLIETQILNWSESFEFGKIRLCFSKSQRKELRY